MTSAEERQRDAAYEVVDDDSSTVPEPPTPGDVVAEQAARP